MENEIENYFIFANYISGFKGIPLNTTFVIVYDEANNSLNMTYNVDGDKVMKFSLDSIQNVSFKSRVRMSTSNKKVEDNEFKSNLLSIALFGTASITRLVGAKAINGLLSGLSNNYDKVDYNSYYEIVIDLTYNNQPFHIMLTSDENPEQFINKIKKD